MYKNPNMTAQCSQEALDALIERGRKQAALSEYITQTRSDLRIAKRACGLKVGM